MPILFLIILLGFCSLNSCGVKQETEIDVYPQLGHSRTVSTAFFSNDGKYIVSSSWDMSVKLWDAASGREAGTFLGHTDRVNYAVISRDNRLIASASQDGTVRIWDAKTGKENLRVAEEKASAVVFGQNDKTIFTIRGDGVDQINQWNTKTGKHIQTFSEETVENIPLDTFSPGNTIAVSIGGEIKLLNIKTGSYITNYITPSFTSSMAISKDGSLSASGTWSGGVLVSENGSERSALFSAHNIYVSSLDFSSDNKYLATASNDLKIYLWDVDYIFNIQNKKIWPRPIKTFEGHTTNNISVSFSPDNRYIVSTSFDKTIRIWDIASGEETTLGGHSVPPLVSVISGDNKHIASLDSSGDLKIWNAKTGIFIESFDNIGEISSFVFAEDNENLIAVLPDGTVETINIKTGKKRHLSIKDQKSKELAIKDQGTSALVRSLSPDGKKAVSVLWDGTIEVLDCANGETKTVKRNSDGLILAAGLDMEGKRLAAGFINGTLQITDFENEKLLLSVQYESPVDAVGFSADRRLLACGLRDGSVRLLDVSAGKEIIPPMRHLSGVSSVSFSADGRRIISAAADNTTVLWDAKTGEKIASFISFSDDEWIAITGDGYYNASPRGDERLNVRTGGEIYGMDQFSAVFFRADVVNARLEGAPPDPAANSTRALVPPAIQINAPRESSTGMAVIDIAIKDLFRPVHAIQIVINGRLLGAEELKLVKTNTKFAVENTSMVIMGTINEMKFTIPVDLDAGSNRIQVIAANREGRSSVGAEGRKSVYIVNVSKTTASAPDLWVLAIGSNSPINGRDENGLKYAVNNAKGITALLESQQGKRYRNVHTRLIADEDKIALSREHILDTIRQFFGRANSGDTLVLFISGHGEYRESGSGYYFLPQAITLDDIGIVAEMPGRKIIFIDSCFSGGVDDKRLAGKLKNQSTAIITSSQKDERSWEGSAAVSYGFFTEAIITGIGGEAAVNNEVKLHNLGDYVYHKVNLLTGGMQNPYVYVPDGFYGYVLAER